MFKKAIIALSIISALTGTSVLAQVRSSDIALSIIPLNPGPNESVTAKLSSYAVDLNKANITWSVDGQVIIAGIGKKSFSFTLGGIGTEANLSAVINTIRGETLEKSVVLTPNGVDMLWEASNSYVPPFYKGKALVGREGEYKVVAIPNTGSANNMSYVWKKDDKMRDLASGWGKNSFIFKNSYLEKENVIEVETSDIFGNGKATGKITLSPNIPLVVLYEKDPVFGIKMERALSDNYTLSKSGKTIVAVPYFFSPKDLSSPDLTFKWSIGGETTTSSKKNELGVKPEEGKSGESDIEVVVVSTKTLFQEIIKTLHVNF